MMEAMLMKVHSPQNKPPNVVAKIGAESKEEVMHIVASSSELDVLLRGLLHELRNPLSSILTAASLVQDTAHLNSEVGEETTMLLGVIQKESLRLNHILTEFANFIKLPPPRPQRFDVAHVLRTLVAQFQRDTSLAEGVKIEDELPQQCMVWADPDQIRNALHQLLCNASEQMPENGVLRLIHSERKDKAVICLGDSGPGFSDESRARAFQPFYSTKRHNVGLGLAAARAIIQAAAGRLWIESDGASIPFEANKTDISDKSVLLCFELPLLPHKVN